VTVFVGQKSMDRERQGLHPQKLRQNAIMTSIITKPKPTDFYVDENGNHRDLWTDSPVLKDSVQALRTRAVGAVLGLIEKYGLDYARQAVRRDFADVLQRQKTLAAQIRGLSSVQLTDRPFLGKAADLLERNLTELAAANEVLNERCGQQQPANVA
jgi:hypothetical protein